MPTYEFKCSICGRVSEEIQSFKDPAPECCGQSMKRLISAPAFNITGTIISPDFAMGKKPRVPTDVHAQPHKSVYEKK